MTCWLRNASCEKQYRKVSWHMPKLYTSMYLQKPTNTTININYIIRFTSTAFLKIQNYIRQFKDVKINKCASMFRVSCHLCKNKSEIETINISLNNPLQLNWLWDTHGTEEVRWNRTVRILPEDKHDLVGTLIMSITIDFPIQLPLCSFSNQFWSSNHLIRITPTL